MLPEKHWPRGRHGELAQPAQHSPGPASFPPLLAYQFGPINYAAPPVPINAAHGGVGWERGGGGTARRCTPSPTPQPSGLPLGIPPHILPPEPAFFQRGNSRRSTTGVLSASNAAPRREAAGSGTHGGGVAPHRTAPLPPFSPLRFRAHGGAVPLCPVLHGRGRPACCADPIAYRSSRGRRQLRGAEPRSGGIARRQRMREAPQQRARIGRAPPDPLRRHHPRRPHRAAGSRSGERAARPGGSARPTLTVDAGLVRHGSSPLRFAASRAGNGSAARIDASGAGTGRGGRPHRPREEPDPEPRPARAGGARGVPCPSSGCGGCGGAAPRNGPEAPGNRYRVPRSPPRRGTAGPSSSAAERRARGAVGPCGAPGRSGRCRGVRAMPSECGRWGCGAAGCVGLRDTRRVGGAAGVARSPRGVGQGWTWRSPAPVRSLRCARRPWAAKPLSFGVGGPRVPKRWAAGSRQRGLSGRAAPEC